MWGVFCPWCSLYVCECRCHIILWNEKDLPAQQGPAECGSPCDPNRGPDITVSLPGGKPNAGPISNLVFHRIWQLVSDDKLTEILAPPGNLWQWSSIHTHTHTHTQTHRSFPVSNIWGACNSIENRKWLSCLAADSYWGKHFSFQKALFMTPC